MSDMKKYKSVKLSAQAYNRALQIRDADPEKYKARGLVGVFDDLLLNGFTTVGKGSYDRKSKK